MKAIVIIETLTSGSGFEIIKTASNLGYQVFFLCRSLEKYTNVGFESVRSQVSLIMTETQSVSKVLESIKNNIRTDLHAVISLSDSYIEIAAEVAENLGLVSSNLNSLKLIRDKSKMREILKNSSMEIPSRLFENLDHLHSWNYFPAVLKTINGTGSIDVKIAYDSEELKKDALVLLKKHGKILVEKYELGTLISHEIVVINEEMISLGFTNRIIGSLPYFVEKSYSFPFELKTDTTEILLSFSRDIISKVKYKNGVLHIEYLLTRNGPKLIEVNGRLGGGMLGPMINKALNINVYKTIIEIFTGKDQIDVMKGKKSSAFSTTVLYTEKSGYIKNIDSSLVRLYPNIEFLVLSAKIGDKVSPPQNFRGDIGYLMSSGINTENAYLNGQAAISSILVEVEEG